MSSEAPVQEIPSMIIVIGSGVFGLSTTLALCEREEYNDTAIVVIDRLPFPAPDGASIDTSRLIRADYADPAYAALGVAAQDRWRGEWGAENRYHEVGLCFTANEGKEEYVAKSLENIRALEGVRLERKGLAAGHSVNIEALNGLEELMHVTGTGGASGTYGYLNPNSGWADAEATMRYLRKRVASFNRVRFLSVGVERLLFDSDRTRCVGVDLCDGNFLSADLVILAAGAWTPTLLDMRGLVTATGQVLTYIELSQDEAEALSKIPALLNMSTGMFHIPPPPPSKLPQPASLHTKGPLYLKIARHAYGYANPTTIPHPEDPTQDPITVSIPHTSPDSRGGAQPIPLEGETACRDFLTTMIPPTSPLSAIANRPFAFTRLCHYADTPTSDFLLAYHPAYSQSLFIATGGSGHAFKFLPVIGEKVVDCIQGKCPAEFREKWGWRERVLGKWIGDGSRSGRDDMVLEEEMRKGRDGESKL